jgi:hypothetical protein
VAGVGHQHTIAAGEAQIGGQSGALVAAFFLDDLDEQDLAALDDVLDFIAPAEVLAFFPQLVGGRLVDRRAGRLRAYVRIVVVVLIIILTVTAVPIVGGIVFGLMIVVIVLGRAKPLFFGGVFGFFAELGFAVGLGNLIIVGMDFREGEEAVAVAPIIDEGRLERRFNAGNLG